MARMDSLAPRLYESADGPALEDLYRAAFPHEDLLPLLRQLLVGAPDILSLVATDVGQVIGHCAFTPTRVAHDPDPFALLGPLAVLPARQGHGIGSLLVRDGFRRLSSAGVAGVHVLGDPAYYGRFGFVPEHGVAPPFPLPAEWRDAWQGVALRPRAKTAEGRLVVPASWMRPELWAP